MTVGWDMRLYHREPRTAQTGPPTRPRGGRANVPPRAQRHLASVRLGATRAVRDPDRRRTSRAIGGPPAPRATRRRGSNHAQPRRWGRRCRASRGATSSGGGGPGPGAGSPPDDCERATQAQTGLADVTPTFSGGTDTTPGSSRQPRGHHHTQTETPEPLEPHRRPDPPRSPTVSPALPAYLRVASNSSPHSAQHLIPAYLICLTPTPCRRPASGHSSFPPGLARPGFTWTVEEGESGAKRRTPLPPKPRREAKETPEGGAAACCAQGRNP